MTDPFNLIHQAKFQLLLDFAKWLLEGEFGEGNEEGIVLKYLDGAGRSKDLAPTGLTHLDQAKVHIRDALANPVDGRAHICWALDEIVRHLESQSAKGRNAPLG